MLALDLLVVTLVVLLALLLNRWLRYRVGKRGVEVFGLGGWFSVPPESVSETKLVAFSANPWVGKAGLNGLSGMGYGMFNTSLGRVHLYGYAYAGRGVLLRRPHAKPVLLTPTEPERFLGRLHALGYTGGGTQGHCYTRS